LKALTDLTVSLKHRALGGHFITKLDPSYEPLMFKNNRLLQKVLRGKPIFKQITENSFTNRN